MLRSPAVGPAKLSLSRKTKETKRRQQGGQQGGEQGGFLNMHPDWSADCHSGTAIQDCCMCVERDAIQLG